jgi:flagellar biogenesis protein FliO
MKLSSTEPANAKGSTKPQITLLAVAAGLWKKALSVLRSARAQRRVRAMHLLERLALGNKQSIVLLRVDGQEYVVGCCGDSMVLLGSRTSGAETTGRHKPASIAAPVTTRAQVLGEPQPVIASRPKPGLRKVQVSDQTTLLSGPKPAKGRTQKLQPRKVLPPTKAQLLKSFAGRIQ